MDRKGGEQHHDNKKKYSGRVVNELFVVVSLDRTDRDPELSSDVRKNDLGEGKAPDLVRRGKHQ